MPFRCDYRPAFVSPELGECEPIRHFDGVLVPGGNRSPGDHDGERYLMIDALCRGRETGIVPGLQHYQIIRRRLANSPEWNPGVERDESPFMLNGKGEEVYVGKLPWAVDSRRVNSVRIQQADFVRPEFVDALLTSFGKTLHDSLDWQCVRIARVRHDTHTPILGDRAGSPAFSRVLRKPTHCEPVRGVIGVEQCDQHVDVQQRAH
jgi:hypothetical protein